MLQSVIQNTFPKLLKFKLLIAQGGISAFAYTNKNLLSYSPSVQNVISINDVEKT